MCDKWRVNPIKNPDTGRSIKRNGPTWRRLERRCAGGNDDCDGWTANRLINPTTGRRIKVDGPTWRELERQCFDLDRFITAQDAGGAFERARSELKAGRKTGHWIWYVFPQLAGLGSSATANRYAISSVWEAKAYLRHPILGERYRDCVSILLGLRGTSAKRIFGVDDVKVKSSLTLFHRADPNDPLFNTALTVYFNGTVDRLTDRLLGFG